MRSTPARSHGANELPLVVIQKDDGKSRAWAEAARRLNLARLHAIGGSSARMPIVLLGLLLRHEQPRALVLRYLNDYPSLVKTTVRFAAEIAAILLARSIGCRVLWICHNIDHESLEHFPRITRLRRRFVVWASSSLLTTDELLVEPCRKQFGPSRKRIVPVSFGRSASLPSGSWSTAGLGAFLNRAREWKQYVLSKYPGALVGLWIGSEAAKLLSGLQAIVDLLESRKDGEPPLAFIVLGPIRDFLETHAPDVHATLSRSERVLLVGEFVPLPLEEWRHLFDFVWKPNDDLSVAMTAYNAAAARLPIIALATTFFGEYVGHYGLGGSLDPAVEGAGKIHDIVEQWSPEASDRFLATKTWDSGATALVEAALR